MPFVFAVTEGHSWGWTYAAIAVPLFGVALGLSLTNGPSSTAATASVGDQQVGAASGISNMARYVGGAIMTPVVTGIYARVVDHWEARSAAVGDALAASLLRASVALALFSAAGVVIALLVARRPSRPRLGDYAATTSGTVCTLPIAERGSP